MMCSSANLIMRFISTFFQRFAASAERAPNWRAYLERDLDDATIDALRTHTKTGRPLGDDSFVDMLELSLDKMLRPLKQGRKRKGDK